MRPSLLGKPPSPPGMTSAPRVPTSAPSVPASATSVPMSAPRVPTSALLVPAFAPRVPVSAPSVPTFALSVPAFARGGDGAGSRQSHRSGCLRPPPLPPALTPTRERGRHRPDYTLAAPVAGKVGVWSKTDSVSEFAEYAVPPE